MFAVCLAGSKGRGEGDGRGITDEEGNPICQSYFVLLKAKSFIWLPIMKCNVIYNSGPVLRKFFKTALC